MEQNTAYVIRKSRRRKMQQRFVLPEKCGALQSVSYVNVKPQYQQEVADGHVELTGIYLIQVELEVGEGESARTTEGILIDEVDLEGRVAYFEYGLPLSRRLEGESLVADYQMEQIEGVILSDGALEIKARENIARKQVEVETAIQPKQAEVFVQETSPEPPELMEPTKAAHLIQDRSSATGIVEWLSLSNHYKTEKIQLNPILQQRVANRTEEEQ